MHTPFQWYNIRIERKPLNELKRNETDEIVSEEYGEQKR